MDDAWGTIDKLVGWLDASSSLPPDTEKLLRIMKLTEEAGEVSQAVIGAMGQNPRKGVTRSYLAWAWNADFNCSSGPGLITDYVPGDPTSYGAAYQAHLASLGL
jgi:hypothetical protein